MSEGTIGVGIIGANPVQSWAARAHMPVLSALPDYRITAVGTRNIDSARAAAEKVGTARPFTDPKQLAEHPDVDLVVVAVKVPLHADLVRIAIEAGKNVYCEWPLAQSTAEAKDLAERAARAGVRHTIGLQARFAPAVAYARDLIADGRLGRIVSATTIATRQKLSALSAWPSKPASTAGNEASATLASTADEEIPGWTAYTLDKAFAAGTLEVNGGHTLDAVQFLMSEYISELSADLQTRIPAYLIAETGATFEVTNPDHLLLHGSFQSGAALSAHIHDAKATRPGTRIEIAGTKGDLVLVSRGPQAGSGIQIGDVELYGPDGAGGIAQLTVPDRYLLATAVKRDTEGFNQSQLYSRLAADSQSGADTLPSFEDAFQLHRLLDTIRVSAQTRTRQTVHP